MTLSNQIRPAFRRSLACVGMAAVLMTLGGCRDAITGFNPGVGIERSGDDVLPVDENTYTEEGTSEYEEESEPEAASSSSIRPAPQASIIDIPSAFQGEFADTGYGYEVSEVYLSQTGDVRFIKIPQSMNSHRQDWAGEIYYIISGTATVTLGEKTSEARAGQMIVVPARTTIKIKNAGSAPVFVIQFMTPVPATSGETQWLEPQILLLPSSSSSSSLQSSAASSL
jgi:mannose-6-phosphate isomerase-like protein (cupin superfamily)